MIASKVSFDTFYSLLLFVIMSEKFYSFVGLGMDILLRNCLKACGKEEILLPLLMNWKKSVGIFTRSKCSVMLLFYM